MSRSPIFHFLLVGFALFVLQSAWSANSTRPIVEIRRSEITDQLAAYRSQIGREPTTEEKDSIENHVIETALWLEQAWALGLHKNDSVIRQRLLLNMRFLEEDLGIPDQELIDRALALGMDKSDAIVRRRLVDRIQAMIRAGVRAEAPDDKILRAYYAKNTSRWRESARLDLTHVYFSRDKRGENLQADAMRTLRVLQTENVEPEAAVALGDPFLSGHSLRGATRNRIVSLLGPNFAASVGAAPTGKWIGPILSAFGDHLVWIDLRTESRTTAYEKIRPRVLEDWVEEETRRAKALQIARRRLAVDVQIIDDPVTIVGKNNRTDG